MSNPDETLTLNPDGSIDSDMVHADLCINGVHYDYSHWIHVPRGI